MKQDNSKKDIFFGTGIKRLRIMRGISQQELASAVGTTATSISGIETGRHSPRPTMLTKIAKALSATTEDILTLNSSDTIAQVPMKQYDDTKIDSSKAFTFSEFGKQVKRLRQNAGLTQQQLADAIDTSVTTISGVEIGRHKPRKRLIQNLANYFRISREYLSLLINDKDNSNIDVHEPTTHLQDNEYFTCILSIGNKILLPYTERTEKVLDRLAARFQFPFYPNEKIEIRPATATEIELLNKKVVPHP